MDAAYQQAMDSLLQFTKSWIETGYPMIEPPILIENEVVAVKEAKHTLLLRLLEWVYPSDLRGEWNGYVNGAKGRPLRAIEKIARQVMTQYQQFIAFNRTGMTRQAELALAVAVGQACESSLDVDSLLCLAEYADGAETIVELGTHIGGTAIFLGYAFPDSKIYTIDMAISENLELFPANVVFVNAKTDASETNITNIGCMFIDGGHSQECVEADIQRWQAEIKDGGYMLFHEYDFESVRQTVEQTLPKYFELIEVVKAIPADIAIFRKH